MKFVDINRDLAMYAKVVYTSRISHSVISHMKSTSRFTVRKITQNIFPVRPYDDVNARINNCNLGFLTLLDEI